MKPLQVIKKNWEIGNLTSGEIAWLIKQAEKVEEVRDLTKGRWSTDIIHMSTLWKVLDKE